MNGTSERTEREAQFEWEATIKHSRLAEFLTAAEAVTDEIRLHIDEDGLSYSSADPANVAIVTGELSAEAFDEYGTDGAEVGLNVRQLNAVLDRLEGEETLSLALRQEHKKLIITAGPYSYTHRYVSPDAIRSDAEMPDLDLSATLSLHRHRLESAHQLADEAADKVNIGYDYDTAEFYVKARGDTDDAEYRVHRQDLDYVQTPGDADSLYHTDYLRDIIGGIPEGRVVMLSVGNEFPYKMTVGIAPVDGAENRFHGDVSFLQAPRIMSDGDS